MLKYETPKIDVTIYLQYLRVTRHLQVCQVSRDDPVMSWTRKLHNHTVYHCLHSGEFLKVLSLLPKT